jgi:hypothetical protein
VMLICLIVSCLVVGMSRNASSPPVHAAALAITDGSIPCSSSASSAGLIMSR